MAGKDWLLPEDGIIDPVAVAVAAAGLRPVRLTPAEQAAAARLIVALHRDDPLRRRDNPPIMLICHRLHVSVARARELLGFPAPEEPRKAS